MPPLEPEAVVLPRTNLARQRGILAGRGLKGVAFSDGLVVLGREETLPWIRGAAYFAACPVARDVFVPTGLMPNVPELLLANAVKRRLAEQLRRQGVPESEQRGPLLLSPAGWAGAGSHLIALGAASPVDEDELARWLASKP